MIRRAFLGGGNGLEDPAGAAGQRCATAGIRLRVPRPRLCTDNGAMVAALGALVVAAGVEPSNPALGADSALPVTAVSA